MYEGEYPSNSDPSRTMMPTAISTYGSIRGASLYWKKVICTMPTPGAISRTGSEGVGIADWSAAADARKIAEAASVSLNKAGLLRGKGGAVHCEGHSPHSRGIAECGNATDNIRKQEIPRATEKHGLF